MNLETTEFYYAANDKQLGPLTLIELMNCALNSNTLIWYEGLDNWTPLKELQELYDLIKPRTTPPPLSVAINHKIIETRIGGEIKLKTEKSINKNLEKIKPTQKTLRFLIIWIGINFLALVTSYSEIGLFSNGSPRTDKFWPFVQIFQYHDSPNFWGYMMPRPEAYLEFHGIFYRYDWSEFLVYVLGAILLFLIKKLSNSDNKANNV